MAYIQGDLGNLRWTIISPTIYMVINGNKIDIIATNFEKNGCAVLISLYYMKTILWHVPEVKHKRDLSLSY